MADTPQEQEVEAAEAKIETTTESKTTDVEEKSEKPAETAPAATPANGQEAEAEECTAEFTPVVQLEEQDVKTVEEEEELLFSHRSKLFVYGETLLDKGTGKRKWNERGKGDIKILQHRERSMIRLLMRQEGTKKIIVNHVLDPRILMSAHQGSKKSWVWSAFDYSSGSLEEKVFAIKFGDEEVAGEFKAKFDAGQASMSTLLSGGDAAESTEANEAADALASLSTKDESEKEVDAQEKPTEEPVAASVEAS